MEMTPKRSPNKWLLGLGIGCGGAVVIVIVLVIAGYFLIRNTTQGFRDSDGLMRSLTDKYGRVEDYCPDPSGAIPEARLEAFLSVRDAAAPARAKLEESLDILMKDRDSGSGQGGGPRNIFQAVRTGLGMVPQISDFLKSRGQALLDKEMGAGEYYYLYIVAYHSWLKKPPTDGAGLRFGGPRRDPADPDDQDAVAVSKDMNLMRIHRLVLPMLRCQLTKLQVGRAGGAQDKWQEALAAEVKAMDADRTRLPWQDGVPEVIGASLRPFRERLEAGYSRLADLFETSIEQRTGTGRRAN
jgi:hypothetical protein